MKKISTQQIEAVLQTVYQTNISAQVFDQLRKLLLELPECKEEKSDEKKD